MTTDAPVSPTDRTETKPHPSAARPPVIEAAGLTRTYGTGDQSVTALRGVDLRVGAGEFVSVVGPSGCGKSTLLFLLGLMLRPSAGTLRIAGRDAATLSEAERTTARRRSIGFVFQRFNLVPVLSALENVRLPLRIRGSADDGRARELLDAVGLGAKADRKPGKLSIGEQQRVAIARALVGGPEVLLADEPTGNLDTEAGAAVLDLLGRFHRERGLAIVMITHNPTAAAVAQRTIRMADGRVVG